MTNTTKKWNRLRFKTKSVDDWRPVKWPMPGPYWCSGYAGDDSYAIIIAYMPKGKSVKKYWPDAYEIDSTEEDVITYSDRFPKPDWWKGSND